MRVRLGLAVLGTATATTLTLVPTAANAAPQAADATSRTGAASSRPVLVGARSGWVSTGVYVERGERFSIRYRSGRWTVDSRSFPWVGPWGYSWRTDEKIFQGCKVRDDRTYGTLLGTIGRHGNIFVVGKGKRFFATRSGVIRLRINDADNCLGDNAGAVRVSVRVLEEEEPA
ncbi:hypothetical protein AB0K60_17065 [Thermopolyspora sp. NPDC052614]|uniref:hypothetical protein n=1 Tax=Thermopolyspora sp. NPDC052614 TaxID=3155682 RepID=UPI00342219D3